MVKTLKNEYQPDFTALNLGKQLELLQALMAC
jgi:hypothetical protein